MGRPVRLAEPRGVEEGRRGAAVARRPLADALRALVGQEGVAQGKAVLPVAVLPVVLLTGAQMRRAELQVLAWAVKARVVK